MGCYGITPVLAQTSPWAGATSTKGKATAGNARASQKPLALSAVFVFGRGVFYGRDIMLSLGSWYRYL